ncbi:MAG TPA: hypothetical protein VKR58_06740 [Aquella sp.]|nr:hypothetical protein [Aquella sp.]
MTKLTKLFFITALAMSTTICFAVVEDPEFLELRDMILVPIINHYPEDLSFSRLVHRKIIEYEKANEEQLTRVKLDKLYITWMDEYPFNDEVLACMWKSTRNVKAEAIDEFYANMFLKSWQMSMANCGELSIITQIVFEFNQMNNVKPLFQMARLARTTNDTGNHTIVLIQSNSGAVFVLDPWSHIIKKLDSFPKLSIMDLISDSVLLKSQENNELNKLYGIIYKDKIYYDVKYVNFDTVWYLDNKISKLVFDIVHVRNDYMKDLYKDKSIKSNFLQWKTNYPDLFLKCSSLTSKTPECKRE